MNPQSQSNNEQMHNEIEFLRRENKNLTAQLSFHRKMFRNVHNALENAENLSIALEQNDLLRVLLEENEELKSRMKYNRLSTREKEVMEQIKEGHTSKEIAQVLNISKLTVDTHRKNMMQKLGASNLAELIRLALMCG
jgi:DNA-binding CsgD family transcriptional regulator